MCHRCHSVIKYLKLCGVRVWKKGGRDFRGRGSTYTKIKKVGGTFYDKQVRIFCDIQFNIIAIMRRLFGM